jgi:SAM-dependent methyltransferase
MGSMSAEVIDQAEISAKNETWWNELCGSNAAREWGITDDSMMSLRRFDANFFEMYPYLDLRWFDWHDFTGKRTLEVGLGYGSVTQRLAEIGAHLTAMDIAPNPVAMARHRFSFLDAPKCRAVQGDILNPPADLGTFERIVAIGCLHHTGDLERAIDSCYNLLEPGGQFIGMVYHAYSHRQWWQNPRAVWRHWLAEDGGFRGTFATEKTAAYDHNKDGSLAPATEFASEIVLRHFMRHFRFVRTGLENTNREGPFIFWKRDTLLNTRLPHLAGLDIYWQATK